MRKKTLSCLLPLIFFSFVIFSSFPLIASEAQHQLKRGESLSPVDKSHIITSPDNTFSCGFYDMGTNAFWFAIWFNNSRPQTVVWVANRDRPVNGKGSKVSIKQSGAMVLTDVDGTIIWQTNTTSTDNVDRAELLNSGNLVLRNSTGEIIWQSFDYPTDTLLPSQIFTKHKRLTSSRRIGSFSPGYYSLYFDSDNVLKLIYDGPEVTSIYWPNPEGDIFDSGRTKYNSTRIASLDDLGMFSSSDFLKINASDKGFGIQRRLTLDNDGNLRIYSLERSTGQWSVSRQAVTNPCYVHGVCGENGICMHDSHRGWKPRCWCPPGFQVNDANDWTKGCKPTFSREHLSYEQLKYMEIPNADYWGFDLDYHVSVPQENCSRMCLQDQRCKGFVYIEDGGLCFPKGTLYNGFMSNRQLYVIIPKNVPVSHPLVLGASDSMCNQTEAIIHDPFMYHFTLRSRVRWIYLYSICAAIGGVELILFALSWWVLFSKNGIAAPIEEAYLQLSSQFRWFTYAELRNATRNFKVELGRGASGAVYKGVLRDGREVAVKKLTADQFQAEQDFWTEISTIGKIYHMNLVRMWGFCSKGKNKLLVYEYVKNSSLDKHLFYSDFLEWEQRFAVALGVAKGLAYLHHECLEWVIHCDLKPENILLDDNFEAKISDFGLAKLSQRGGPCFNFSTIRGTKGYLAPEWGLNQPITAKVDVYGYGIVILEMVKGSRLSCWVVDDADDEHEAELKKLTRMVKRKIQCGEDSWVEDIVDPRLKGKYGRKQAKTLIEIGIVCVEEDRNKRPAMASVIERLLMACEDETNAVISE